MPSILFVCTGNQFRSPVAAAAFSRQLAGRDMQAGWTVESAGTWGRAGQPPMPLAVLMARHLGLDIAAHRTRIVSAELLANYDLILVMEHGHKEALSFEFPDVRARVHLLSAAVEGMTYDIPDPADPGTDVAQALQLVQRLVEQGFDRIVALAQSLAEDR